MKVNLGCGRNILPGWVNVDSFPASGVDRVFDLDECALAIARIDAHPGVSLDGFERDSVDEFLLSHVLEHLVNPLPMFEWAWRIAKPGAVMTVRVPYGASDDADEDPTHVRRMFVGSWGYFGQPHYWRADYGYRGDWQCRRVLLRVDGKRFPAEATELQVRTAIQTVRNVVFEMEAELVAVKPRREPLKELQEKYLCDIEVVPW
jgi:hypothetical protein